MRTVKEALCRRTHTILPERPIGWPMKRKEYWLFDNRAQMLLWAISTFVLEPKFKMLTFPSVLPNLTDNR